MLTPATTPRPISPCPSACATSSPSPAARSRSASWSRPAWPTTTRRASSCSPSPGNASTNVAFLFYKQALLNFDVGVASAGALFAVVLANIAAIFLIRMVGKNLD